ncbi:universal stress protein [Amorphus orientalis]|uniref:Nucleotide-binding universal stress UspA family protein n=1 Tax=Amorphus orientalis TaxID=649198 RepID=A0AAE4AR87_9HYPH|nr:universal stress protein [Amorphus orientalis]MDQ0313932.1 nucleotide-binding universal stress UspA family protein [Amorphus orientalis]
MFKKIMLPIDLEHVEQLEKAVQVGIDLARLYESTVCLVGVTTEAPSAVAHNPDEFAQKLQRFASELSEHQGLPIESVAYAAHDPSVDLDKTLMGAAAEVGADLVVMASHVPGFPEHFFASHGGHMASHAPMSVMVVR